MTTLPLEILRDLTYVGLCEICGGALWVDSWFRVYKNGEDHVCKLDKSGLNGYIIGKEK